MTRETQREHLLLQQWQEFVRIVDFSVMNSSQDSHRQFRMKSDRLIVSTHYARSHVTAVSFHCKTRWSLWEIQSAWTLKFIISARALAVWLSVCAAFLADPVINLEITPDWTDWFSFYVQDP